MGCVPALPAFCRLVQRATRICADEYPVLDRTASDRKNTLAPRACGGRRFAVWVGDRMKRSRWNSARFRVYAVLSAVLGMTISLVCAADQTRPSVLPEG